MAAVSGPLALPLDITKQFFIEPTDPEYIVRQKIQGALVFSMKELSLHYQEKWNNTASIAPMTKIEKSEKIRLLQLGPWLAHDLYCRCEELNQTKLIQKYKNNNHFVKGYMDSKLFDLSGEKDLPEYERYHFFFQAKPGQQAYALTMNALTNFSIINDAVAMRISQYRALAMCLGEKRFNFVFSESGYGRLNFSAMTHLKYQPLMPLLEYRNFSIPIIHTIQDTFELGDVCLFLGHPEYQKKHCFGSGVHLHTIYCGDGRDHSFSHFKLPDVSPEGSIHSHLALEYNLDPVDWTEKYESRSEKGPKQRRELRTQSESAIRFCTEMDIPGLQAEQVVRIRARVLQALAQTSKDKLALALRFRKKEPRRHVTWAR